MNTTTTTNFILSTRSHWKWTGEIDVHNWLCKSMQLGASTALLPPVVCKDLAPKWVTHVWSKCSSPQSSCPKWCQVEQTLTLLQRPAQISDLWVIAGFDKLLSYIPSVRVAVIKHEVTKTNEKMWRRRRLQHDLQVVTPKGWQGNFTLEAKESTVKICEFETTIK